jgi:hypothetical protein
VKIEIQLDLDSQAREDGSTYLDQILDHAARQLLDKVIDKAAGESGYEWLSALHKRADAITDEMVRQRVVPIIEDQMENLTFRKRDTYGDPIGPNEGVKGFIEKIVKDELRLTDSGNSFGRRGESTLEKFIKNEIKDSLSKELRASVEAARSQVREALKTEAATIIEKTITGLAGVK